MENSALRNSGPRITLLCATRSRRLGGLAVGERLEFGLEKEIKQEERGVTARFEMNGPHFD